MSAVNADSITTGANAPVATPFTQIYWPPSVGSPHCVIFNNGASPAYLGGSGVTSSTGFCLPPGAQVSLASAVYPIFAAGGGLILGTVSTTITIDATAGGTVLAVAGTASIAPGTLLQIGNLNHPAALETVIVSAVPNAGSVTTRGPLQMDHVTGGTVWTISAQQATALSVNTGIS